MPAVVGARVLPAEELTWKARLNVSDRKTTGKLTWKPKICIVYRYNQYKRWISTLQVCLPMSIRVLL